MVNKKNILLISTDENCVTEVTDILSKSKCVIENHAEKSSNPAITITESAYSGGPPTEINGDGSDNVRVYFVLKILDADKFEIKNFTQRMCQYHAVIIFVSDKADTELILDYMSSLSYLNGLYKEHNVTLIGKDNRDMIQSIHNLLKYDSIDESIYCAFSTWNCDGSEIYNWSTDLQFKTNNLWARITNCSFACIRVSYNSEIILNLLLSLFEFFNDLLYITCRNTNNIRSRMQVNCSVNDLLTLTREGDSYRQLYKLSEDLLSEFNVSNILSFEDILQNEMKQLAHHLSLLAILHQEMVLTTDLYNKLFNHFRYFPEFKGLYYKELILNKTEDSGLQRINRENICYLALQSLNAMSEMKYTGKYVKNVFGAEKINTLMICLEKHYSFRNKKLHSPNAPPIRKRGDLRNRLKQDSQPANRIQDLPIEYRIGNIQLLKSLQETFQEFREELRNVRQLQEHYVKVMSKDIRDIKEKLKNCNCNSLNQKHDEACA